PAGLCGDLGKLVRTEDDQGQHRKDQRLAEPYVEHPSSTSWAAVPSRAAHASLTAPGRDHPRDETGARAGSSAALAHGQLHRAALPAARVADLPPVARRLGTDGLEQLVRRAHRLAVESDDDVTRLQARLVGRSAWDDQASLALGLRTGCGELGAGALER